MALSGNTRELSLADLILLKAHDPGSYRLRLSGPAADAAYLLVTEEEVSATATATTIHATRGAPGRSGPTPS
jgi:hypothetical protein